MSWGLGTETYNAMTQSQFDSTNVVTGSSETASAQV